MKTLQRKLHFIIPQNISFDKNNPRGLSEKQIMGSPQFSKLVNSIKEYGILEPLIVKPDVKKADSYILIDGERRLRASLAGELSHVPVLIAKDDTDGRILAYQVHMLRENWDKAAETKAIKKIIFDLKEANPHITEAAIRKNVEEVTSHTSHEITDLLRLIKYDDKIIERVLAKELSMSYLVQIEANFISPLRKKYSDIYKKYGEDKVREILIQKALEGKLINTRFLMDEFKEVFSHDKPKSEIEDLLINFLEKKEKSLSETLGEFKNLTEPSKKTKKGLRKPATKPGLKKRMKYTSPLVYSPRTIKVSVKQQASITDIRTAIEKIGGSFTENEYEYISEALFCLEIHCFKASTLMIWSCCISRILEYVGTNLKDFNDATQAMFDNRTSAWKHFAKDFQKNISSLDELLIRSNDLHLLCYLVYKKILTVTQFNALRGNYQTRCDCAHPTDIKLSPNNAITIFENIYNYVLTNGKLR